MPDPALVPLSTRLKQAAPPQVWAAAQRMVDAGSCEVLAGGTRERRVQVTDGRGQVFTVAYWPEDGEWECDCPSTAPACLHAACGLLALEAPAGAPPPSRPRHAWLLSRGDGEALVVRRGVVHDGVAGAGEAAIPPEDVPVARLLAEWPGGRVPARSHPAVVRALAGVRSPLFLDGAPVSARSEALDPVVRVDALAGGHRLRLDIPPGATLVVPGAPPLLQVPAPPGSTGLPCLRWLGEGGLSEVQLRQLRPGVFYGDAELSRLGAEVIPALERKVRVVGDLAAVPKARHAAVCLRLDVKPQPPGIEVTLRLVYGDPPLAQVVEGRLVPVGGAVALPRRDVAAEARLAEAAVRSLDLRPGDRRALEGAAAARFLERAEKAVPDGIHGLDRVGSFRRVPEPLSLQVSADGDRVVFRAGAGEAAPGAVAAAIQGGERMVPLLGGGWAELPAAGLDAMAEVLEALALAAPDGQVPLHARSLVPDLCAAAGRPPPDLGPLADLLRGAGGIPSDPLPGGLQAELRPYQRRGVDWLRALGGLGLGGVLADDMGLGKTVQAIAALLAFRGEGPALVVAPTSVLHNWQDEMERFAPSLRCVRLHGPGRAAAWEGVQAWDVGVTSYALLRLDADGFQKVAWSTVVLDEAQAIKNPASQTARAARRLTARRRFALTGTPIENHLSEMWSLMEFLNPGFLGRLDTFERRYGAPAAAGDPRALRVLRSRIRPFLLRRRKADVAPELPARTEVVLRAPLSRDQIVAYQALLQSGRRTLMAEVERRGVQACRLSVLALLTRLRQVCCHPGLLPGGALDAASGKLDLFDETLDEALEEGHRALVFSQFTALLDRVEPRLRERGIGFVRLDGSTRDRKSVVAAFQDPQGPPVFLLSLKAGGAGLNLTAADHVFHLDPWWNPAVEDQAVGRAHRIGQLRPVVSWKLVSAGTVEDRILELQRRKRALVGALLEGGDEGIAGTLDTADLAWLLEGPAEDEGA